MRVKKPGPVPILTTSIKVLMNIEFELGITVTKTDNLIFAIEGPQ